MPSYDAIIIGAGMSGLAAGIRLAHFGQRVCILERHYAVGGLNSYYRLGGRDYDVGLHAVTNYAERGAKRGPLARALRQLRLSWDDIPLAPQRKSKIAFPGVELEFSNDPGLLESEIARAFPRSIDGWQRLLAELLDYDAVDRPEARQSAREIFGRWIADPLLVEMLFCPLMYYGAATEHDMDIGQASIMVRSIFLEGFGRPPRGVRSIIKCLVRRFKELGGELRLRAGVQRIETDGGRAIGVVLDDGQELSAARVLSSIGWNETLRLCEAPHDASPDLPATDSSRGGRLSFVESISTLDIPCRQLGHDYTIVFFNDHEQFDWRRPEQLVDYRSGVICAPDNYQYPADAKQPDGAIRLTALANYDHWAALDETNYRTEKTIVQQKLVESGIRFVPDFRPHIVDVDLFTPTTIRRFTGHDGGAVYGAPQKHYDGLTPIQNLFLCGTDQGYVGIVGALNSGIGIANRHFLAPAASDLPDTNRIAQRSCLP